MDIRFNRIQKKEVILMPGDTELKIGLVLIVVGMLLLGYSIGSALESIEKRYKRTREDLQKRNKQLEFEKAVLLAILSCYK